MNRPPIRSFPVLRRRLHALLWLQCSGFHLQHSVGASCAAAANGAPA